MQTLQPGLLYPPGPWDRSTRRTRHSWMHDRVAEVDRHAIRKPRRARSNLRMLGGAAQIFEHALTTFHCLPMTCHAGRASSIEHRVYGHNTLYIGFVARRRRRTLLGR